MKTNDVKIPYEILIRFDEAGALQGAHYAARRVVTIDGEVVKDEVQPPVPVRLAADADLQSGDAGAAALLEEVLGASLVQALASASAANEELAGTRTRLEEAEDRAARSEEKAARLQERLAAAANAKASAPEASHSGFDGAEEERREAG